MPAARPRPQPRMRLRTRRSRSGEDRGGQGALFSACRARSEPRSAARRGESRRKGIVRSDHKGDGPVGGGWEPRRRAASGRTAIELTAVGRIAVGLFTAGLASAIGLRADDTPRIPVRPPVEEILVPCGLGRLDADAYRAHWAIARQDVLDARRRGDRLCEAEALAALGAAAQLRSFATTADRYLTLATRRFEGVLAPDDPRWLALAAQQRWIAPPAQRPAILRRILRLLESPRAAAPTDIACWHDDLRPRGAATEAERARLRLEAWRDLGDAVRAATADQAAAAEAYGRALRLAFPMLDTAGARAPGARPVLAATHAVRQLLEIADRRPGLVDLADLERTVERLDGSASPTALQPIQSHLARLLGAQGATTRQEALLRRTLATARTGVSSFGRASRDLAAFFERTGRIQAAESLLREAADRLGSSPSYDALAAFLHRQGSGREREIVIACALAERPPTVGPPEGSRRRRGRAVMASRGVALRLRTRLATACRNRCLGAGAPAAGRGRGRRACRQTGRRPRRLSAVPDPRRDRPSSGSWGSERRAPMEPDHLDSGPFGSRCTRPGRHPPGGLARLDRGRASAPASRPRQSPNAVGPVARRPR